MTGWEKRQVWVIPALGVHCNLFKAGRLVLGSEVGLVTQGEMRCYLEDRKYPEGHRRDRKQCFRKMNLATVCWIEGVGRKQVGKTQEIMKTGLGKAQT